jgi:tetratricopeptide (TPR) repeat protein
MHLLIVGGTRDERIAQAHARSAPGAVALDAATLPFVRPARAPLPGEPPRVIHIDDIERAFPNAQTGGTRLVLTQSTYVMQKWIDVIDPGDRIIASADRGVLTRDAQEALQGRGPWARFEVVDLDRLQNPVAAAATRAGPALASLLSSEADRRATECLMRAYESTSAAARHGLCADAAAIAHDSPVAWLALASACREQQDMAGARAALDRAADLAPDWEAVHYEDGKFWLGYDDMERARDAFQRACDRMPTFSAACSNLGATLGELDQPAAALAAFQQALANDPRGFTILNNVGVVSRELGRLDESEAAFRRVIAIEPGFVFGYYNLGHTLFLAGQYEAALAAYEEGQHRDPEKNRRQGCRLAAVRLATGDLAGAERDLWRFADEAPADEREDLLLEVYEIAQAVVAHRPAEASQQRFLDRIRTELSRPS